ncbi:TetR/AcrR family transcriptional regulator [Streptomyces sp. NPDC001250]|uniref:TetR/AcrR family transcriptional regulator n=1 Tax=unclassified Streptomyces TaxID=2593676 RepID=UPI00331E44DA
MGLPTSIEVAWGLREPVTKGPKRVLSLERIVGTAVKIAEESGLGAVSMNRIARELNSSTMSLYRYVSAKDELLPLMVDQAFGPPVAPDEECVGWRAGLEHWSWSYLAVLRRHSWVVHVPIGGPPSTPNQVAWVEQGLSFLEDVNLEEAEKLSTILLLAGIVRNDAMLAVTYEAFAKPDASGREVMMEYRRLIEKLADKERFPAINKVIQAGVFDSADDQDTEFIFALRRVLDGVDALIYRRTQS